MTDVLEVDGDFYGPGLAVGAPQHERCDQDFAAVLHAWLDGDHGPYPVIGQAAGVWLAHADDGYEPTDPEQPEVPAETPVEGEPVTEVPVEDAAASERKSR